MGGAASSPHTCDPLPEIKNGVMILKPAGGPMAQSIADHINLCSTGNCHSWGDKMMMEKRMYGFCCNQNRDAAIQKVVKFWQTKNGPVTTDGIQPVASGAHRCDPLPSIQNGIIILQPAGGPMAQKIQDYINLCATGNCHAYGDKLMIEGRTYAFCCTNARDALVATIAKFWRERNGPP
eukprot:TRINITY_DN10008_c0_g1_i1.p1 TRINITY_DN10008_c0_g1~~TRINITY_DN10008_c0_g1_i1.p1  ORF type:complete len:179 (-),score=11.53 TRINITY_DN10008_c0_g1_i1:127-663(-)